MIPISAATLSEYLGAIARIHATGAGTGEVSYYGALANAFNAVGSKLKPRVFCRTKKGCTNPKELCLPRFSGP